MKYVPAIRSALASTAAPAVAIAVMTTAARAQNCVGPIDLGTLPGGSSAEASAVNSDGSVVVGWSTTGGADHAFRWTPALGMQDLGAIYLGGSSYATDVSADGRVLVGWGDTSWGVNSAWRWTSASGMQTLVSLGPGFLSNSRASGVSADGTVVVGTSSFAGSPGVLGRAFRWTASGGLQDLGTLGGGESAALAVSADGSVVVGWAEDTNLVPRAFRWTAATGMQDLGTVAGTASRANDVSDDGSVIVGSETAVTNGAARAFRWTASGGVQGIGGFAGPGAFAAGVNPDGSVVVGAGNFGGGAPEAFRWDVSSGTQWLQLGLSTARDVSAGGGVVVGSLDPLGGPSSAFLHLSNVVGVPYCGPAVANSTGCGGKLLGEGDPRVVSGALTLRATALPASTTGYFVTSRMQGFVAQPGGSQGNLCLGGQIGRFGGAGRVQASGTAGTFSLSIDLTAVPSPLGPIAVQPGETWNFQAWYRDANPGPTSNFTDAISVTFQ